MKEQDEQDAADDAGVEPFAGGGSGKQVEYDPNGLFAGVVRVARQAPEAGVHKAFAVEGAEVFAGGEAAVLFALKGPLLLVGHEFKCDEGNHGQGEQGVECGEYAGSATRTPGVGDRQGEEQDQAHLVDADEEQVKYLPNPRFIEGRNAAQDFPAVVFFALPGEPAVASAACKVEGEARTPQADKPGHQGGAGVPLGKPSGVYGVDDGHGAPKSVHLAVVSGEESGDEGVGGESGPNGDEVAEELRLLGFERWAIEP